MNDHEISKIVESVVKNIGNTQDMTLSLAKRIAEKVEAEAAKIGLNVVIAVSNSAARPVLVESMDDALIASYDIALNKAYTVVAVKMSTLELKGLTQPNQPLYGIQFTNDGQVVVFGGGVPLKVNGKIIGGLGISGGSEDQDVYLAEFGKKAFDELINK
jgi:uncharacterized protein GlcG (DUF336 family)